MPERLGGDEKAMLNIRPKPEPRTKQLWIDTETPTSKPSVMDPSNITSVQAHKLRAQGLLDRSKKSFLTTASLSRYSVSAQSGRIIIAGTQSLRQGSFDTIQQPETRPISQEQLVAQVKDIYAGLVMVEARCVEVNKKQAILAQADPTSHPNLNKEQWQALIALHRTLLHEHHDFFSASQYSSASLALRRLASKYAMPAKMWRHGIHSFLELLRHRLPASLHHMLAFIYLAYSMMALLYETVPAFEDTWLEFLDDLGRFRMALEDDDIRDSMFWTRVAQGWYDIARTFSRTPTTGRLYHHLAILTRSNALEQLFYDSKSPCVVVPLTSARESTLTLVEQVYDSPDRRYRLPPLGIAFVKAHGFCFTNRNIEKFELNVEKFSGSLDHQIGRITTKSIGFASKTHPSCERMDDEIIKNSFLFSIKWLRHLKNQTLEIGLKRIGDPNGLPFVHGTVVFLWYLSKNIAETYLLDISFPWRPASSILNKFPRSYRRYDRRGHTPRRPIKGNSRLPQDFSIQGLLWTETYYPDVWFTIKRAEEEEMYSAVITMSPNRRRWMSWPAHRIASIAKRMAKVITAALRNKSFGHATFVIHILNLFPTTLASVINKIDLTTTEANAQPGRNGDGPSQYFKHLWLLLRDENLGPIMENTIMAAILSSSYFVITYLNHGSRARTPVLPLAGASASRQWLEDDLLPIATTLISIYTLYLGNGELDSDWQLAMLATHNVCLSIKVMQQELSKFPRTQRPAEFIMASTSLFWSGLLTKFFVFDEGRYRNPLIQAAMLLPLMNLYLTILWIRLFRNSGISQALEEGELIAAIRTSWATWSFPIMAILLMLLLLAKF
ncbi:hypothetical protein WAI453_004327 [Rhynchosporium graminicola]|uniref:DNA/RNA-binding domain-containing protein n=1 Tax=Rhynchosporium graminicola TaxID=2792576 RepID=A0A1E1LMN4_9HELO|nr:uncharacterized protein RCO7_08661 [Rhynchosporium commune]